MLQLFDLSWRARRATFSNSCIAQGKWLIVPMANGTARLYTFRCAAKFQRKVLTAANSRTQRRDSFPSSILKGTMKLSLGNNTQGQRDAMSSHVPTEWKAIQKMYILSTSAFTQKLRKIKEEINTDVAKENSIFKCYLIDYLPEKNNWLINRGFNSRFLVIAKNSPN